jgi:hypothetical protein
MEARYDEKIVRKCRDKNLSFWSEKQKKLFPLGNFSAEQTFLHFCQSLWVKQSGVVSRSLVMVIGVRTTEFGSSERDEAEKRNADMF